MLHASEMMKYISQLQSQEDKPLTFTCLSDDGVSISLAVGWGTPPTVSLYYSVNGSAWTAYTSGDTVTLSHAGDYLQFKGDNSVFNSSSGTRKFVTSDLVAASGNIMSILDSTMVSRTLTQGSVFRSLFANSKITTAPVLPATTLSSFCYNALFSGCTYLTGPVYLPASVIPSSAYASLFTSCSSLTHIRVNFTSWGTSSQTQNWVNGISASGIFEAPEDLPIEYATNRMPSGWTVFQF